jgi:hypothetical protein
MLELLLNVVVIALLATFAILVMEKTGARQYLTERSPRLISEMFQCSFCLSFWTAVIISVMLGLLFRDVRFFAAPFLSAPITRMLL